MTDYLDNEAIDFDAVLPLSIAKLEEFLSRIEYWHEFATLFHIILNSRYHLKKVQRSASCHYLFSKILRFLLEQLEFLFVVKLKNDWPIYWSRNAIVTTSLIWCPHHQYLIGDTERVQKRFSKFLVVSAIFLIENALIH